MGERIVERLRALGYWKNGAPDIGRFCQEKGYRPQYVYAWVKNRVPGYENLVRLTRDLETTKAWLLFGIQGEEAAQAAEAAPSGRRSPGRARRSAAPREPGPARDPGGAAPAQIIDFARLRDVMTKLGQVEGQLDALARVGREILETLDLDGVMQRICSATLQVFPGCAVMVHRLDRAAGGLVCAAGAGGAAADFVGAVTPLGVGVAGRAALEGRPVWSADAFDDPAVIPVEWGRTFAASGGYRAVLGVPLRVRGEVIGVLGIGARTGRTFAPDEMATVCAFADHVAMALENARLYREARTSAERFRALNELNRLVSSSLDVDTVLRELTLAAAKLVPADFAQVGVADEAQRTIEMRVDSSERGVPDLPIRVFRYGESLAGWVAEHRQPLEVRDVYSDPRPLRPEWWRRQGLSSYLGLPIIVDDRFLGLLSLYRGHPFDLGPADRLLLDSLLAQATAALRNAQVHAASEERRQTAETLADMARLLSESLDPDAVACLIVDRVNALLRTTASTLYSIDPGTGDLVAVARGGDNDYGVGRDATFRLPGGTGLSGLAVRERRAVSSPDVFADPRVTLAPEVRAAIQQSGNRAMLSVPLMIRGEVVGALSIRSPASRQFTEAESSLAQAFAAHAAIALDNARRFRAQAG